MAYTYIHKLCKATIIDWEQTHGCLNALNEVAEDFGADGQCAEGIGSKSVTVTHLKLNLDATNATASQVAVVTSSPAPPSTAHTSL